jgi:hypothetical protein
MPVARTRWLRREQAILRGFGLLKNALRIVCLFSMLLFVSRGDAATQVPISIPIHFGSDGFVEFSVELTRYRNYYFDLVFTFKTDEQRVLAKKAAGEPTPICRAVHDCGQVSNFNIRIQAGNDIVLEKRSQAYGYYAHGAYNYSRNIIVTPLRPGIYVITMNVLEFGPELSKVNTLIEVTTDARERDLGG